MVSALQAVLPDDEALARVCQERGVARLRVFGSATGDDFDPERSDLDFLVDFIPERPDILGDFFCFARRSIPPDREVCGSCDF